MQFWKTFGPRYRVLTDGTTWVKPKLLPAEVLHTTQGEPSLVVLRACQMSGFSVWYMASWNVRTLVNVRALVNVKGPIETARRGCDANVVDESVRLPATISSVHSVGLVQRCSSE